MPSRTTRILSWSLLIRERKGTASWVTRLRVWVGSHWHLEQWLSHRRREWRPHLRGAKRWRSQGWTSRRQFSFCSSLSSFFWAVLVFVAVHSRGFSSCNVRATLFAVCRLRSPMACGILVPQSEIKSASPALEDGLSIPGPPGKSIQGCTQTFTMFSSGLTGFVLFKVRF